MSNRTINAHRKLLALGQTILSGLQRSSEDMDDVMHDMEFSEDHNRTAQKLNDLYDTIARVPDIPRRRSRKTKKATQK